MFEHEHYGSCTEWQWVRTCSLYDGDRWHNSEEWPAYDDNASDGGLPKGTATIWARYCNEILQALNAFRLADDSPKRKPATFEGNNQCCQRVLFSGLDCLPGQVDLFGTDGEEPTQKAKEKPAIVPWPEAQCGDRVARGWLLFMRRLYCKAEAKRIAAEEGGKVRADSPGCWAVVVPELE